MCELFRLSVLHAHPVYSGHQHPGSSAWWPYQDDYEEGLLPGLWVLSLDLQGCGNGRQISWWVNRKGCLCVLLQCLISSARKKSCCICFFWLFKAYVLMKFLHCSQWWMARAGEPPQSAGKSCPRSHLKSHKLLTWFLIMHNCFWKTQMCIWINALRLSQLSCWGLICGTDNKVSH